MDNLPENSDVKIAFKIFSTFKFIEPQASDNSNLNCREIQCRNNITEVCCGCEVDGPFYYIKTDTKENIANCERGTDDSNLCNELSFSCF